MIKILKDEIKFNKATKEEKFTGSLKAEVFSDDACTNSLGTVEFRAVGSHFNAEVHCEKDKYGVHIIAYVVFSLIQEYFDYRKLDSKCYISLINSLARKVNPNIQIEMAGILGVLKDRIDYQSNKPDCELASSTIITCLYPKYVAAETFLGIE